MIKTEKLPSVEQTEITGAVSDKQSAYAFDLREKALHEVICWIATPKIASAFEARGIKQVIWDAAVKASNDMTDAKTIINNGQVGVGRAIRLAVNKTIKANK